MMRRAWVLWTVAAVAACGDGGSVSDDDDDDDDIVSIDADPTQPDGSGGGGGDPLYDGPVGGALPGWDADAPIPLVALATGPVAGARYTTLLRVAPDGTLSENTASNVVVWGWAPSDSGAPQLLYDGAVGGALPGWNPDAPIPLVMLGRQTGSQDWIMTLASVSADGTIGDNVADRIVVWGWPGGGPTPRYDGPVDASAALSSWAPPEPLVMGGALGALWFATLARIDSDGSLHENVSNRLIVWGF